MGKDPGRIGAEHTIAPLRSSRYAVENVEVTTTSNRLADRFCPLQPPDVTCLEGAELCAAFTTFVAEDGSATKLRPRQAERKTN